MKKALLIIVPTIAIVVVVIAFYYNNMEATPLKKVTNGKYYYDFDEVVHYQTDIDETDLFNVREKKVKTTKDSMMLNLAWNYYRFPLSRAITYLDSVDFKKQLIPASKNQAIRDIFKEKKKELDWGTACEPVYRNIYIFKKKGKIMGLTKICNDCGKSIFYGTNADTDNFGSEGEYAKLKEVVSNL